MCWRLRPAERDPWLTALAQREPSIAADLRILLAEHQDLDRAGFLAGTVAQTRTHLVARRSSRRRVHARLEYRRGRHGERVACPPQRRAIRGLCGGQAPRRLADWARRRRTVHSRRHDPRAADASADRPPDRRRRHANRPALYRPRVRRRRAHRRLLRQSSARRPRARPSVSERPDRRCPRARAPRGAPRHQTLERADPHSRCRAVGRLARRQAAGLRDREAGGARVGKRSRRGDPDDQGQWVGVDAPVCGARTAHRRRGDDCHRRLLSRGPVVRPAQRAASGCQRPRVTGVADRGDCREGSTAPLRLHRARRDRRHRGDAGEGLQTPHDPRTACAMR